MSSRLILHISVSVGRFAGRRPPESRAAHRHQDHRVSLLARAHAPSADVAHRQERVRRVQQPPARPPVRRPVSSVEVGLCPRKLVPSSMLLTTRQTHRHLRPLRVWQPQLRGHPGRPAVAHGAVARGEHRVHGVQCAGERHRGHADDGGDGGSRGVVIPTPCICFRKSMRPSGLGFFGVLPPIPSRLHLGGCYLRLRLGSAVDFARRSRHIALCADRGGLAAGLSICL